MDRMFGTVYGNSRLFFVFHFQRSLLVPFLKNVYGYWKFSLYGLTGLLFGDQCDAQHGVSLLLATIIWSITSPFSFRATYIGICFDGTEMINVVQSDR